MQLICMLMTKITYIIFSAVFIILVLYFGEGLDRFLRNEFGSEIASRVYGVIIIGVLGILTYIYWRITK